MIRLPQLTAEAACWRLPLFRWTSIRLANALLEATAAVRCAMLEHTLREDAALTLWCLGQGAFDRPPPLTAMAEWLSNHAPRVLVWRADERAACPASPHQRAWWYAECRSTSAPRAASPEHPVVLGMLQGKVQGWLASSHWQGPATGDWPSWVPPWLRDEHDHSESEYRRQASGFGPRADLPADGGADEPEFHLPQWLAEHWRCQQLASEFARMLEQEKLAAMRELAYGASHEINNPLANISTRAQALLRDETDAERRRKLATIHTQAMRAHEMISDMMLFAKPPALRVQAVNLNQILDQAVGELESDARRQATVLARLPSPGVRTVAADPDQLLVCLKSIGANALEALGQGGRVEWSVSELPPSAEPFGVEIVVRDTGPGMTDEVRRHAFDPFFSGREAGRGLGFGLSKCWRIVQLHGGQIDLAAAPEGGTVVTIRLKAQRDDTRHENHIAGSHGHR